MACLDHSLLTSGDEGALGALEVVAVNSGVVPEAPLAGGQVVAALAPALEHLRAPVVGPHVRSVEPTRKPRLTTERIRG